jgi:hypothetical protein
MIPEDGKVSLIVQLPLPAGAAAPTVPPTAPPTAPPPTEE